MNHVIGWVMRRLGRRTCEEIVGLLRDYSEGALDPETTAIVERHFQGCADCHAFAQSYEMLVQITGELACDEMPEEVQRHLHDALLERSRLRGRC